MYQQQVAFLINLMMFTDGLIVIACGYGAAYIRWYISQGRWHIDETLLIGLILFLMFVNNFVMGALGQYSDRRSSLGATLYKVVAAVVIVFSVLNVGLFAFKVWGMSRLFLAIYAANVLLCFIASRIAFELLVDRRQRQGFNTRRILIVGDGQRAQAVQAALERQKSWGHRVIGRLAAGDPAQDGSPLDCLGHIGDLEDVLRRRNVDEVIFALPPECTTPLKPPMELCEEMGVPFKIVPALYDPGKAWRLTVESIQDIPTISRAALRINPTGLLYKRITDFVFGSLGCLLLLAMLPAVALAIRLDSPGPVFFRQRRMGQNGRIFDIVKFRTMYIDAEQRKRELLARNEMQGLMFKMKDDPRITPVGRFLRKTSLDEFPQFINVLRGEMSLVGTRPPTLDEVERYEPWHRRRMSMKPGITGLWQVSGRNKITDFDQVVRLDLQYIDTWRFLEDLKIILLTLLVIIQRKGAS